MTIELDIIWNAIKEKFTANLRTDTLKYGLKKYSSSAL